MEKLSGKETKITIIICIIFALTLWFSGYNGEASSVRMTVDQIIEIKKAKEKREEVRLKRIIKEIRKESEIK